MDEEIADVGPATEMEPLALPVRIPHPNPNPNTPNPKPEALSWSGKP